MTSEGYVSMHVPKIKVKVNLKHHFEDEIQFGREENNPKVKVFFNPKITPKGRKYKTVKPPSFQ